MTALQSGYSIFSYDVEALVREYTKRIVLSEFTLIFDPFTFFIKHLSQHFWCLGIDREETPPPVVVQRWTYFKSHLNIFSKLQIQRSLS